MSKKLWMIVLPASAVLSFGLMFGVAWLTRPPAPEEPPDEQTQLAMQTQQAQLGLTQGPAGAAGPAAATQPKSPQRRLTEKALQDLVAAAKEKQAEYDLKLAQLAREEQRLKTAQETLAQQIKDLEALRVEVADAVATLKAERDRLEQTRIMIEQDELANLQKVAKAYAAMKGKASALLVDLCQDLETPAGREKFATAVKILYNIDDKTQAKIFAEMSRNHADIAGRLTMELKRIAVERAAEN